MRFGERFVVVGANAALALAVFGAPALAQVGYTPERSPFRDLEYRQEFTVYGGYFKAAKDPAGVAPQAAPLLGLRYDIRLGGPAYFTVRAAGVQSQRMLIDPSRPVAQRALGTKSWPLLLTDLGFTFNLTGAKTFHSLAPTFGFGVGVAADLKSKPDTGLYKFGTPFALSYGLGLKWIPGGRLQARIDAGTHLYQIKYPDTYYRATTTDPSVVPATQAKSFWKNNGSVTFGLSYLFFR